MRKLIYIMGCANCGSTLLTTLLGRHSQVATVGELKLTAVPDDPDYACGCGERLADCEFWRQVGNRCAEAGQPFRFPHPGFHFSSETTFQGKLVGSTIRGSFAERLRSLALDVYPPARAFRERILQRNRVAIDAVCRIEGKPVFLDGSKDPARLRHFVESGEFDVRAIHLVRDGRAIVASYTKRDPDNIDNCLHLWRTKAEECENLKSYLGASSMLTLRYEDLCRDVKGSLAEVFRFCGIANEAEACLKPTECASVHIIGHASRLGNAAEIRLRDEWRTMLDAAGLERFHRAEGRLNRRYGYPREDGGSGPSVPARPQSELPG